MEAKESGQRRLSRVTITNRKQLTTLFHKRRDDPDLYRREDGPELARGLYPLPNRVPEWAQEKGRQTYVEACKTGKKWPEMTKGCMLRRWGEKCDQPICFHDPHPGVKCHNPAQLSFPATSRCLGLLCVVLEQRRPGSSALEGIPRISNSDFTLLVTANGGRVPRTVGAIFGANGTKTRRAYRHTSPGDVLKQKCSARWSWSWQHSATERSARRNCNRIRFFFRISKKT